MRNRIISTLIIGIFTLISGYGQDTRLIKVIRPSGQSLVEWNLSNSYSETIVTSQELPDSDTASVMLLANKHYNLQISIDSIASSDTILLSLLINESPILMVLSDIDEGDHQFTFFTGVKKPQLRIVGGAEADIEEFPWQACFLPGDYLCGGAILSEKWIITAAHCMFDNSGNGIDLADMKVVVGTSTPFYSTGNEQIVKVKNFYIRDEYDINGELYDLALLELEDSIDIKNATPIDLISTKDIENGALDPGVLGWVTGWGKTDSRRSTVSNTLQKVQLPVVSNETASSVWGKVDDSFLMAGYSFGNKDACSGDSGGPFVVETDGAYKLAGVVSWGSTECDTYGAYTRISTYEDWIRKISGVKSRSYLDTPVGDNVVCVGETSSVYYTDLRTGATEYQWKLLPDSAGDISFNSNTAVVEWDGLYSGEAKLEVRAVVDNDTLNWSVKTVQISDYTSVKSQSDDLVLCEDQDLQLSVDVKGYDLIYTWYKDNTTLEADSSELIVEGVTAENSGVYFCQIKGACGEATTKNIFATIYPNTAIADQPEDIAVEQSGIVALNVNAIGEDLEYRWYKGATLLEGEYNPDLILENVDATDIALYAVEVSSKCGDDVVSDSAFVYVNGRNQGVAKSVNVRSTVADKEVRVAVDTLLPYTLEVFNQLGQRVYIKRNCLYDELVSIDQLMAGVYFIRVSNPVLQEVCKILKHEN